MTSNHIKMFAKAKEIQEGWKPEVGDRIIVPELNNEIHVITRIGKVKTRTNRGYILKLFITKGCYAFDTDTIFLPSIEQMEADWHEGNSENDPIGFLNSVVSFIDKSMKYGGGCRNIICDWPLPIIVLAFIQHELHGLTWSEEKGEWVEK